MAGMGNPPSSPSRLVSGIAEAPIVTSSDKPQSDPDHPDEANCTMSAPAIMPPSDPVRETEGQREVGRAQQHLRRTYR